MSSTRSVPRISLNKLGEYLTATPARRKKIIIEQKEPKIFVTARYTGAQEIICKYVQDGLQDDDFLLKQVERLQTAPFSSEWDAQSNKLCAAAISNFIKIKDDLPLRGCTCSMLKPEQPAIMNVAGVNISIRPEMSLSVITGKKAGHVGLIKLAFSKTYKVAEKSGDYVATLLHEFASAHMFEGQQVWSEKCLLVDVFGRKIVSAPTARKKRIDDIIAACEEIKKIW